VGEGGEELVLGAVGVLEGVFGALAVGDVDEDVDGTDQLAGVVADGVGVGEDGEALAVGALDEDFLAVEAGVLLEGEGHPALVVVDGLASRGGVELERAAEAVNGVVELGGPAPDGDGVGVVVGDQAGGITGVGAGGEFIEESAEFRLRRGDGRCG
jgi:hypothetical protein